MKALFEEAMDLMGARLTATDASAVAVDAPPGSIAAQLLGGEGPHAIHVEPKRRAPGEGPAHAAASLVGPLKKALVDAGGNARHGVTGAAERFSRAALKDAHQVFLGDLRAVTSRKAWQTTVRCHARMLIIAGDLTERMLSVDVLPDGTVKEAAAGAPLCPPDTSLNERPPQRRDWLSARIESCLTHLEAMAAEAAAEANRETARQLYETLSRVRSYHRQVAEEAERGGDAAGARAAEAAYEMRKNEEVSTVAGRARVSLAAVESLSQPTIRVRWDIGRKEHVRTVTAVFPVDEPRPVEPVLCDVCKGATTTFGLTTAGVLVCPECYVRCAVCGDEMALVNGRRQAACGECFRPICDAHADRCRDCGSRLCPEHAVTCACGCTVCRSCARTCPDCGDDVAYCRYHGLEGPSGAFSCTAHAVYCAGCHDPFPESDTAVCGFCGQVLCRRCLVACEVCGTVFCLNHTNEGRCSACRQENPHPLQPRQSRLF